jgi:hypothetical protein
MDSVNNKLRKYLRFLQMNVHSTWGVTVVALFASVSSVLRQWMAA